MRTEVDEIAKHARPKIKALLRTRGIYDITDMLQQFKTHLWGYLEYHNGALLHATATVLRKIERLQESFVSELALTEEVKFLDHNFAPPVL